MHDPLPSPASAVVHEAGAAPLPVRLLLFVVACGSVFPLLAWVYGLGSFQAFALVVGLPCVAALVVAAIWMDRTGRWPVTRSAILAGAIGGLLGTLAYDLFRVPFVYGLGLQLLAPIDSYGVLLLGADTSSPLTAFSGWAYHFTNGIGFGIAYAVVAAGRNWRWGLAWGLLLETVVVLSPFAGRYGLVSEGQVAWLSIGLAYLAHGPYGIIVGLFGQHALARAAEARSLLRSPVLLLVGLLVAGLVGWHQPWRSAIEGQSPHVVSEAPAAVVMDGRFVPLWLRVPVGGCALVVNGDQKTIRLSSGATVEPGAYVEVCGSKPGTQRVRVDDGPFSGGWLLVDPAE